MKQKDLNITFFAYGTNISQSEMKSHSESAVFIGYGELENFELKFRGFPNHAIATIQKKKGARLPIAIYDLMPTDRFTLDNFEKFPYAYKKQKVKALFNGKPITGYIYFLKIKLDPQIPSDEYIKALRLAYFEAGFDDKIIDDAILECGGKVNEEELY
ncbi:MAG: gamma-glutamylcyclotransferase [Clostridia bacterium]|nr:gamma-glutamylcyclotransferase [Clostridia bacterium]